MPYAEVPWLLSSLLRLQKIRSVEELQVDLALVYKIGDLNGMGRLNFNLLKILVFERDPVAFLVAESLDNFLGLNLFFRRLPQPSCNEWD